MGNSWEDFLSKTTQSHLLLRNKELRPKTRLKIRNDSSLRTQSKVFDISDATTARVAPHMVTTQAIPSDTPVKRFAIDRGSLKSY